MYSGSVAATGTHAAGCAAVVSSAQSTSRPGIIGACCCGRCRMMQRRGFTSASSVAFPDAQPGEGAGEAGDLIAQLAIREALDRARDRTVVDERRLVGAAVLHVPVEGVVAGVHLRAREPAVERGTRAVEHTVPPLV